MNKKTFYNRPIGVLAILLSLLLFGSLSLSNLQISLFPDGIRAETVSVTGWWDASSPQEMLDEIVRPAESILRTVPGVKTIETYFKTRRLSITVYPDKNEDIGELTRNISESLDDNFYRFPSNFGRPKVSVGSSDDVPMVWLSFSSSNLTRKQFEQILTRDVFPAILETEGVGGVDHGIYEGGLIDVSFNSDKVASGSINMRRVINHLSSSKPKTLNPKLKNQDGKIIETPVHFSTENLAQQGIQDLPISESHRLSDVAHFKDQPFGDFSYTMIGGGPGEFVQVFKSSDANSYRTSERLIKKMKPLSEKLGLDMQIHVATNHLIDAASKELILSAMIGGIAALSLLLFFLRRVRMAIMISLSLPLSLTLSLMAQSIQDISVSIPTMIGYILAIGMVIDNGIVIGESVIRVGKEHDLARRTQLVKAAVGDVAMPIIISTLTTLAIFTPLFFIEVSSGFKVMIMSIGLPVAWSLVGSLLLALLVLPIGYLYFYPKGSEPPKDPFWLRWMIKIYQIVLTWMLKHTWTSLIISALLIIPAPYFMIENMGESKHLFKAGKDLRILHMTVRTRTRPEKDELEKDFKKWHDQIWAHRESLALRSIAFTVSYRYGTALFAFEPIDPQGRTSEELRSEIVSLVKPTLNIAFPEHYREGSRSSRRSYKHGKYGDKQDKSKKRSQNKSVEIVIVGHNQDDLNESWSQLSELIKNVEGVVSIENDSDNEMGDIELRLLPESARAGFTPELISSSLRPLTTRKNVLHLPDYWILRVGANYREDLPFEDLMSTSIQNDAGVWRSLDSLVAQGWGPQTSRIYRYNGMSYKEYKFTIEKDAYNSVIAQLPDLCSSIGLSWKNDVMLGWDSLEADKDFQHSMMALALAIFLIYLIMGILYESFLAPLAVMTTVPLTMVSIFSWMILFEIDMTMMVILGLLFLIGIVVNNGIVLIDRLRKVVPLDQLNGSTEQLMELSQAAGKRFVPIMLTSLTTISGGIAMAAGESKIAGISIRELGLTMSIGLFGSTLFTLFIVPLTYVFIGRCLGLVLNLSRKIFRLEVQLSS